MIQAVQVTADEARSAAETLYRTEGMLVALESGYTMAGVVKQAREESRKVIVANVSSGETDRQFYSCDVKG
jgi:tryptophan synthase beta subunit